jgi:hypothetical protein
VRVYGSAVAGGPAGGTHVDLPGVVRHVHEGRREWSSPIPAQRDDEAAAEATRAAERDAQRKAAQDEKRRLAALRGQRTPGKRRSSPKSDEAKAALAGQTTAERRAFLDDLVRRYRAGETGDQLAAATGRTKTTIYRLLEAEGVERNRRPLVDAATVALVLAELRKGCKVAHVARALSVSEATVRRVRDGDERATTLCERRLLPQERDALRERVVEQYRTGREASPICAEFGIGLSTFYRLLREAGVERNRPRGRRGFTPEALVARGGGAYR